MELDDVGKIVEIRDYFHHGYGNRNISGKVKVNVIMGIKASKGQMFLFGNDTDNQCEAIKAFMEQHKAYMPEDYGRLFWND